MPDYNRNSRSVTSFHAFPALEDRMTLAGYAALVVDHGLSVPAPDFFYY